MPDAGADVHLPLASRRCKLYPGGWNGQFIAYNAANNNAADLLSRCDYAISSGSLANCQVCDGNCQPTSYAAAKTKTWLGYSDPNSPDFQSGVSFVRSVVTPANITRGQAHIVMLGEKSMDPEHYNDGMDGGDNESLYVGQDNDNYRTTNIVPTLDTAGSANSCSFGSATSPAATWPTATAPCISCRTKSTRPCS